jgi:hypothetical protein
MYKVQGTERLVATVRQAAMGFTKLGAKVESTAEQWEDFWPRYIITQRIFAGGVPGAGGVNAPNPTPEQIQSALETRGRNTQRFYDLFAKYDLLLSATAQFTAYIPVHGVHI